MLCIPLAEVKVLKISVCFLRGVPQSGPKMENKRSSLFKESALIVEEGLVRGTVLLKRATTWLLFLKIRF
jgi:hypothetical protein